MGFSFGDAGSVASIGGFLISLAQFFRSDKGDPTFDGFERYVDEHAAGQRDFLQQHRDTIEDLIDAITKLRRVDLRMEIKGCPQEVVLHRHEVRFRVDVQMVNRSNSHADFETCDIVLDDGGNDLIAHHQSHVANPSSTAVGWMRVFLSFLSGCLIDVR